MPYHLKNTGRTANRSYVFSFLALFIAVVAFGLIYSSVARIERLIPKETQGDKFGLPDVNIGKFEAGYGGFLGSLAWVKAISGYAGYLFNENDGSDLSQAFGYVAILDTNWSYPLHIASWALSDIPSVPRGDVYWFVQRGAYVFPDDWLFRITWSQLVRKDSSIEEISKEDSLVNILLPLTETSVSVPEYARNLALTILNSTGKVDQAICVLVESYIMIPDPLIRVQFQRKIGDLLWRNDVLLGSDSSAFVGGVGSMLDADSSQAASAKDLLIRLVQPETKDAALQEARHLARQFRAYQAAQLGTQR